MTEKAPASAIGRVPLDDIRAEAERVATGAIAAGLQLRLMGGMAVYLTSPTVRRPPYARDYGDFDFAVAARDARAASAFLEAAGYVAERMFNALHGSQRLNFLHPAGRWPIDVVVDEVRMSHRIDLRGRINGPGPTLQLADLLLTKLQIWEINPNPGPVCRRTAVHPGDGISDLADAPVPSPCPLRRPEQRLVGAGLHRRHHRHRPGRLLRSEVHPPKPGDRHRPRVPGASAGVTSEDPGAIRGAPAPGSGQGAPFTLPSLLRADVVDMDGRPASGFLTSPVSQS